MRVLALGYYYNEHAREQVAPGDWEPTNFARFVFAVKEGGKLPFRGYTDRVVGRRTYRVGDRQSASQNARQATELCLAILRAMELRPDDLGIKAPTIFVPVPSRAAVVGADEPDRWGPRDLARGVAGKFPCHELVRFTDPPPTPASKKGMRDAHALANRMALVAEVPRVCVPRSSSTTSSQLAGTCKQSRCC